MSLLKLEIPVQTPPFVESLLELDQAILDALPLGIYACDVDGQIIRINRRAIEALGPRPQASRSRAAILRLLPRREPGR